MKAGIDNDILSDWYSIIERIEFFQNEKHKNSRQLSLELGKHEGYISKLRSRDVDLPLSVLLEILHCLQVPMDKFFAKNFKNYATDDELYSLINSLSAETKQEMISLIKKMK